MLNNKQLQNKFETERIVDCTVEVLNDIMAQLERQVQDKQWTCAHNTIVNFAHGLKLLHGALDSLSDVEQHERTAQN